jgi:hypothetical protein
MYRRDYILQDLRLLCETALTLLWRLDPIAAIPAPEWSSVFLGGDAHRAASELMHWLLLILDRLSTIETVLLRKSLSVQKRGTTKGGYPLRYLEHDLLALDKALTQLAHRLCQSKSRPIGSNLDGRRLRWLAQNLVARTEPILEAVSDFALHPGALLDTRRRKTGEYH